MHGMRDAENNRGQSKTLYQGDGTEKPHDNPLLYPSINNTRIDSSTVLFSCNRVLSTFEIPITLINALSGESSIVRECSSRISTRDLKRI